MAYVGVADRLLRFPWPHLLEAQVVPYKPPVPRRLHRHGSILHLGHCVLYRFQDCAAGALLHAGHIHRAELVCMPEQVRLYALGTVPLWRALGGCAVWLHVHVLPQQQHGRSRVWRCLRAHLFWIHPGGHTDDYAPLPCRGGDCGVHLALPRHHQPVPRHPEDSQLAEPELEGSKVGV